MNFFYLKERRGLLIVYIAANLWNEEKNSSVLSVFSFCISHGATFNISKLYSAGAPQINGVVYPTAILFYFISIFLSSRIYPLTFI